MHPDPTTNIISNHIAHRLANGSFGYIAPPPQPSPPQEPPPLPFALELVLFLICLPCPPIFIIIFYAAEWLRRHGYFPRILNTLSIMASTILQAIFWTAVQILFE